MIRSYLFGVLVIFILIPQSTYCIFLRPMLDIINTTGNLTCFIDSSSEQKDFQLCAIRVYTVTTDEGIQNVTIQSGMWFTNTFRQLIKARNCTGFDNTSNIGFGTCAAMDYEIATAMTLCICDTNSCNGNLSMCLDSISTEPHIPLLEPIISDLTTNVPCDGVPSNSFTCVSYPENSSWVDTAACQNYVRGHAVLCTITENSSGEKTQQALIAENYQTYLTGRLHELKVAGPAITIDISNQTDTNIYVRYTRDNVTAQECACTQSLFCNYNMTTCAPGVIQAETLGPIELTTALPSENISISTIDSNSTTVDSTTINSVTLPSETTDVSNLSTTVSDISSIQTTIEDIANTTMENISNIITTTENRLTENTTMVYTSDTSPTTETTANITVPENLATMNMTIEDISNNTTTNNLESTVTTTENTALLTDRFSENVTTEVTSTIATTESFSTINMATQDNSTIITTTVAMIIVSIIREEVSTMSTTMEVLPSTITTITSAPNIDATTTTTASPEITTTITTSVTTSSISISQAVINTTSATDLTTVTSMTNVTTSNVTIIGSRPAETGLSRGAIAGIVVGVVIPSVMVLSLLFVKFFNSGLFQWPTDRLASYRV